MTMQNDVTDVPPTKALTVAERLAKAKEREAAREAARLEEQQLAELERLELVERFEVELKGKVDRDFAIVDASDLGEGFVVVKLGPDVVWKTFTKTKMEDVVELDAFVIPCLVHPSADDYRALVKRRSFIADRSAKALGRLYGVKAKEDAGK